MSCHLLAEYVDGTYVRDCLPHGPVALFNLHKPLSNRRCKPFLCCLGSNNLAFVLCRKPPRIAIQNPESQPQKHENATPRFTGMISSVLLLKPHVVQHEHDICAFLKQNGISVAQVRKSLCRSHMRGLHANKLLISSKSIWKTMISSCSSIK